MIELRLALVFTVRELDLDINYRLWRETGHGDGKTEDLATVNGEYAYRCGKTIGVVKENLPLRVRRRNDGTSS